MNTLRLQQPALLFQQRLPSLELFLDRADRLFEARPRHDEMAFRIHRQTVVLPDFITGERIKRGELVDLVAPELDSESDVFVRGVYLNGVAPDTEGAALEIQVVPLVENLNQFG